MNEYHLKMTINTFQVVNPDNVIRPSKELLQSTNSTVPEKNITYTQAFEETNI